MGGEIKNGIHKSKLRSFGYVMWMGEERIPKKMLHTKMEGKLPRKRPRTRWMAQILKYIEIRGGNWEEIQDNRNWQNRGEWRFICNIPPISLETT